MADEVKYQQQHHETKIDEPCCEAPAAAAATPKAEDRGLFDFLGKKEEEEKKCDQVGEVVIVSEFEEKAKICEKPKHKKLHRSGSSSSSSSSDEEEEDENGEKKKKKKGLKEKIKEKISGGGEKEDITAVSIEKCEDDHVDEKKGFLDKIKEKLPGGKKTEEVAAPPQSSPAEECSAVPEAEGKEKKGLLDKIKEKLPGYHPRSDEEKEKEACH